MTTQSNKQLEKEIRRIFNPYGVELKFSDKDWEVFLFRFETVLDQALKSQKKECRQSCVVQLPRAGGL